MINGGKKKGGDNKYGEKGEAGRGVNLKRGGSWVTIAKNI
jgi:hypothetical protein